MKRWTGFLFCLTISVAYLQAQVVLAVESFEGSMLEHGYRADPPANCACCIINGTWEITDDSGCVLPTIQGADGTHYLAAEKVEGVQSTSSLLYPRAALYLDSILITGTWDLKIQLMAARGMAGYFEANDWVKIQYAIDDDIENENFTTTAQFIASQASSADLLFDADADGQPDSSMLTNTFKNFIADLGPVSGDYLSIRLLFASNGHSEEALFDRIQLTGQQAPLPVEIGHFDLENIGASGVRLHWQITDVADADRFILARSYDGQNWEEIEQLRADQRLADYQLTDAHPHTGINYYRLQVVEKNGHRFYSEIRSVQWSQSAIELLAWSPNPVRASDPLRLEMLTTFSSPVTVEIIDPMGRVVSRQTFDLEKGKQEIILATDDLPAGLLFFQIKADQKSYFQHWIVVVK